MAVRCLVNPLLHMRSPKVPRILFCSASGAEEKAEVHNSH